MAASVKQILDVIDQIAPFDAQEPWDNAGLLAGRSGRMVTRVLAALDLTPGVIDEALQLGAELVLTHHPILFSARKNLCEDDPEGALLCALVRADLSLIAAHTNFDVADGGVNDALARAIGLTGVSVLDGGLRVGAWRGSVAALQSHVRGVLGDVVRLHARDDHRIVERVAVCGGAGGSYWRVAFDAGAEAFITGEVRHHDALMAASWGLDMIEAGHYATERPSVKAMQTALQNRLNALQYNVMVFESECGPF